MLNPTVSFQLWHDRWDSLEGRYCDAVRRLTPWAIGVSMVGYRLIDFAVRKRSLKGGWFPAKLENIALERNLFSCFLEWGKLIERGSSGNLFHLDIFKRT